VAAAPHDLTLPEVIHRAGRDQADLEAVIDGTRRVTYGQLQVEVDHAAAALMALGVAPGDRVSLWAPNSVDWLTVAYGVYACGAILVPLNTRFKGDEAAYILNKAGVELLITAGAFLGTDYPGMLRFAMAAAELPRLVLLGGSAPGATAWADALADGAGVSAAAIAQRQAGISPDNVSDIIFTSGTTGAPKGAMLTHGASTRTYLAWTEAVGLVEGDRYLCVYPFFHTAGLKSAALACALVGATLLPLAVFDVAAVMALVAAERVTVLPGPPSVFQSILSDPNLPTFDFSSLRLSITGAAVVPVQVVERMRSELHIERVVTGYGLTETTGTVTMCHFDDPAEVIAATVGRPLPGVEVRIVDDLGAEVPTGQPGEVTVRGFNVMKGYFADPDATAAAIDPDGWMTTGDIGTLDERGYLRITDRKKDMFIVGGFNAYPAEIEKLMLDHPDIAQVAVVGVPDERLGEVGVAFVIARPGCAPSPDDIVAWSRDRMANFKVPRRVVITAELPLNPSGKVLKFRLRQQAASG
jgi:acyl-CoA synthetase (AMP-forming)/AMP-acid ligase II